MKLIKKIWNINSGNIIAMDWNHLKSCSKYKGNSIIILDKFNSIVFLHI